MKTTSGGPGCALQLFIGKGGVGKTTISAATAVALADEGARVLLVSVDQAHSLGDAFGLPLDGEPGEPAHVSAVREGLDVLHLDSRAIVEKRWQSLLALIEHAGAGGTTVGPELSALEPEELTAVPGIEELAALVEVAALRDSGQWDAVIVDCAPTSESLRLLALPGTALAYLERVWPRHRRLTTAARFGGRGVLLVGLLERFVDSVEALRKSLADPKQTSVRLVLSPERVVLAETRRTITALALLGIRLDAVIANRILVPYHRLNDPVDPARESEDCEEHAVALMWYRSKIAEQQAVLADLADALGDVPLLRAEYRAAEPVGTDALAALAQTVYENGAGSAPVEGDWVRSVVEHESGTGLDSTYLLRLSLPLVNPRSITLGRVEDDLVVGAAGVRTRVTLPSVLRRCTVAGAEFDSDQLCVRFRPDPAVWPK